MLRGLAALWKGLRLLGGLTIGLSAAVYARAAERMGRRPSWLPSFTRWLYGRVVRILGLRAQSYGVRAPAALLVANHVSWLDVPVLGALGEIQFLSKAEIRRWPVIGWMASVAGTLFISRGANETGRVIATIARRIRSGESIVIFPEGTTTDGTALGRFHPRLFAIVQEDGIQIQPVALRYGTGPCPDPIAPFIGDDSFLAHLLRILRVEGLAVRVEFLPPLTAVSGDRRQLAEQTRSAIAGALGLTLTSRSARGRETEKRASDPCGRTSLGSASASTSSE